MSFRKIQVNASDPASLEAWCKPMVAKFDTDHLILKRCTAMTFERLECFEFISSHDSLSIVAAFENPRAAIVTFERFYDCSPTIHTLTSKPVAFENVRTVDVRDICGEAAS